MTDKKPAVNYGALNEELKTILDKLQTGELDIDEALAVYERGMVIVSQLQDYLKTAENQVVKLKKKFGAQT